MNKYRAMVVDFDGTLVDSNFSLSPKVKNAIKELMSRGCSFSIATGRPYWGIVKRICKELNLVSPQITSGGAEIVDPKTEKVIWTEFFPKSESESLIKYFLNNNYNFGIESEGYICTPNDSKRSGYSGYGPGIPSKKIEDIDFEKIVKMVLFNVALIGDPQAVEESLGDKYQDLHFIRSGKKGSPLVLDITSAKATKHLAVLELSKILNVDPNFMIGVGDGYNDYPLLSVCGYKVAMENAPQELKDIADKIIPDAEHEGLVTFINCLYNTQ